MDRKKLIAIVFILLMVGSSIGAMVTTLFAPKNEVKIPNNLILTSKLSEAQKIEMLNLGFTIVEYNYPQTCFSCEQQKGVLESWVLQSENQVYLQEGYSSGSATHVTIDSYKGSENFLC